MSEKKLAPEVAKRRLIVRLSLVAIYIVALGLTFIFGKGHALLIDNKDAEDGSYTAVDGIMVSIDGSEALELYSGDRDMVRLKGQNHRVTIETFEGVKTEMKISIPIGLDMALLSVPRLQAGLKPAVEVFVPLDQVSSTEEVGNSNAFTSPGGDAPVEGAPDAPPLLPVP